MNSWMNSLDTDSMLMRRNNLFLIGAILLLGLQAAAQPVFTYGKTQVSTNEFQTAFLKNRLTNEKPTEKEIQDYLNLYIRFKLKVQDARDKGLEEKIRQQEEVQLFRTQLEETFLTDQETMKHLVQEAAERGAKDIRLAHIFIPSTGDSSRINAAYNELKKGVPFAKVADTYSADPAVTLNHGDIGFISVFTLPYALESVAYTLAVGNFSTPFRSAAGWHIFQKTSERSAMGRRKISQLFLPVDPDGGESAWEKTELLADSLFNLLQKGEAFESLTKSFGYKGDYRTESVFTIGIGEYASEFEQEVYQLSEDRQYTRPFRTSAGFHVVKRLASFQYSDTASSPEFTWKRAVETDPRGRIPKQKLYDTSMAHFREQLEEQNPAFREQLRELIEGNLVFEIMEQEVWTKAEQDTARIRTYYATHRSRFSGTMEDVRAEVVTAIQKELEDAWITALQRKYPVTVNKKILSKLIQEIAK